jgi:hypothetical protein
MGRRHREGVPLFTARIAIGVPEIIFERDAEIPPIVIDDMLSATFTGVFSARKTGASRGQEHNADP